MLLHASSLDKKGSPLAIYRVDGTKDRKTHWAPPCYTNLMSWYLKKWRADDFLRWGRFSWLTSVSQPYATHAELVVAKLSSLCGTIVVIRWKIVRLHDSWKTFRRSLEGRGSSESWTRWRFTHNLDRNTRRIVSKACSHILQRHWGSQVVPKSVRSVKRLVPLSSNPRGSDEYDIRHH